MVKNFYPDKPVVPFQSVNIGMQPLINAIKASNLPVEVQRAVYIVIRNETANGRSVVNGTNPGGVQSDSGQWPAKWDSSIVATSVKTENRTGKERGFVVFDSITTGVAFMCERIQARGIYIGGTTHKITNYTIDTVSNLCKAYYQEWVEGDAQYHPTDGELDDFISMYNQSTKIFPPLS